MYDDEIAITHPASFYLTTADATGDRLSFKTDALSVHVTK
jgi:hypothetical protein